MKPLKTISTVLCMGALLVCVGCGEPKLDTSSEEAFSASLEKVYNSVPETEREAFRDYFGVVVVGRGNSSGVVPSFDTIAETYSLLKRYHNEFGEFGKESDRKIINVKDLNGLTKSDIIAKGKTIWKNDLEEELAEVNKTIEEGNNFADALSKVSVKFGKVEATEHESRLLQKGMVGGVSVNITITNGSSVKLRNFRDDQVTFFDGNGKEVDSMNLANLNDFVAEDGSRPFSGGYSSPGLAAGKTSNGRLTKKFSWVSSDFLFPPQSEFRAAFKKETFKPILDWEFTKRFEPDMEQLKEKKAQILENLERIK